MAGVRPSRSASELRRNHAARLEPGRKVARVWLPEAAWSDGLGPSSPDHGDLGPGVFGTEGRRVLVARRSTYRGWLELAANLERPDRRRHGVRGTSRTANLRRLATGRRPAGSGQ